MLGTRMGWSTTTSGIQKPFSWVRTGKRQQHDEEGHGQREHRQDQLLLGDQVHEVTRDQTIP